MADVTSELEITLMYDYFLLTNASFTQGGKSAKIYAWQRSHFVNMSQLPGPHVSVSTSSFARPDHTTFVIDSLVARINTGELTLSCRRVLHAPPVCTRAMSRLRPIVPFSDRPDAVPQIV